MTQRNPMNPRTQNKSYSGVSRKSASSAKPVREAGASVYTKSDEAKTNERKKQKKETDKEEERKMRDRQQVLGAGALELPEYKRYRRYWTISIVLAIVCVILSWGLSTLTSNGTIPDGMTGWTTGISMVILFGGYAAIIACILIDVRKMRPIRKKQENLVYHMSKRELQELDDLIAQSKKKPVTKEDATRKKWQFPWSKKKDEAAQGTEGEEGAEEKAEK